MDEPRHVALVVVTRGHRKLMPKFPAAHGRGMPRRWKVFVQFAGPTYSFADEAKARARAQSLVSEYLGVQVYNCDSWTGDAPFTRDVYTPDAIVHQALLPTEYGSAWTEVGRSPLSTG